VKGINYRQLLSNWDAILWKLCEECTPYDCLGQVKFYLESSAKTACSSGVHFAQIDKAINLIDEAMKCIDTES
jgi:hypothetical protein